MEVSYFWRRKKLKAGSCRSTDVTKLFQKQRRDGAVFRKRGSLPYLYRGTHRVENPAISLGIFFKLAASQSPSNICRAAAVGKIATRRLITRIILASVVSTSSRRRWGLLCCCLQFTIQYNKSLVKKLT